MDDQARELERRAREGDEAARAALERARARLGVPTCDFRHVERNLRFCTHLLESTKVDFHRRFTGRGVESVLLCVECAKEGASPELLESCAECFARAEREKGITGENLLKLLERRLDNVVFRLGMAASRRESRQMVGHGHIQVNGRKVSVPSYIVRVGEAVQLRPTSKMQERVADNLGAGRSAVPAWLDVDVNQKKGTVRGLPVREDIQIPVQEQLIVELFSK